MLGGKVSVGVCTCELCDACGVESALPVRCAFVQWGGGAEPSHQVVLFEIEL